MQVPSPFVVFDNLFVMFQQSAPLFTHNTGVVKLQIVVLLHFATCLALLLMHDFSLLWTPQKATIPTMGLEIVNPFSVGSDVT